MLFLIFLTCFLIRGLGVSEREEYKDESHQNCDHEGDEVMIGNCAQVSDQHVWLSCDWVVFDDVEMAIGWGELLTHQLSLDLYTSFQFFFCECFCQSWRAQLQRQSFL